MFTLSKPEGEEEEPEQPATGEATTTETPATTTT